MPSGLLANTQCVIDEGTIPLTDVQFLGAHNSYHLAPTEEQRRLYALSEKPSASPKDIARLMQSVDYSSPTLQEQLQAGSRMFEIDLYEDQAGGKYHAAGKEFGLPAEQLDKLKQPGFKVFHVPDKDMGSQCLLFANCLRHIAAFHRTQPLHLPVFILFEAKGDGLRSETAWRSLVNTIRAQIEPGPILTPSSVRGDASKVSWPSVADARGHVVFMLFDYNRAALEAYAKFASRYPEDDIFHLPLETMGVEPTWQRHSNPVEGEVRQSHEMGYLTYSKADTMNVFDPQRTRFTLSAFSNLIASDRLDWKRDGQAPNLSFDGSFFRARNPCR